MKKAGLLFLGILLAIISLTSISCSQIKYFTNYDGGFDPTFDFKDIHKIGFCPTFWTTRGKSENVDEIMEKRLFALAKTEFEKRGFSVYYLRPEQLIEEKDGNIKVADTSAMPDLILTVGFSQGLGEKVQVPGGAFANNGVYSRTDSYKVQTYVLNVSYSLWTVKPPLKEKVWSGAIRKESPTLDLSEQVESMVKDIFAKKYDIK